MLDNRRIASRIAFQTRAPRALAAAGACMAACLLVTQSWQAVAADSTTGQSSNITAQAQQLAQPSWFFTNEDQRAAAITEAQPNTPVAPLAQPTFIAPESSNIPAVYVPPNTGNRSLAMPPATNSPPMAAPAPMTAQETSRWRSMLRQFIGAPAPPENSRPYAEPPFVELPPAEARFSQIQLPPNIVQPEVAPPKAPTHVAVPRQVLPAPVVTTAAAPASANTETNWSASQAGGSLIQQAAGINPLPVAPANTSAPSASQPSASQVSMPAQARATNQLTLPVVRWDAAQVGGELLQQMTGTIPTSPAPVTTTQASTSPKPQVAAQPLATAVPTTIARTTEVGVASYVMPAPAVVIPQPTTSQNPQPAQMAAQTQPTPPIGDPFLNKLADFTTSQSGPTGAVSALWQPILSTQGAPQPTVAATTPTITPASAATPMANASPYPSTATPNAPLALTPTVPAQSQPAAQSQPKSATLEDSIFLQPFYQTNTRPSAGGNNTTAAAGSDQQNSPNLNSVIASPFGGLLRQFTLSTTDDLRKPPAQAAEPEMQPTQKTSDGSWTASSPNTGRSNDGANAALVAYLQEAEAIPEPIPADLDVRTGESVQPGQGGAAAQGDSLAQADRLGEEPENNTLQFLRSTTVLLEPGESQYDVGIGYALAETDFPLLLSDGVNIVGVADAEFRVRQLTVPIEYRLGLTKRVQGFVGVPLGWANTQVAVGDTEAHNNDGGLGDVNFGLTIQLKEAEVDSPYWVGTLAATAPTGGDPFSNLAGISPSAPSLGQGFWSIQGNLLFIQPYDPIVVFYGLGMERFVDSEYRNIEIRPGAQYSYTLGVGFAVNDRVTISSRFRGAYQEETEADGDRIIGSNSEPMTLRFAATISKPCHRIVEPFVEFGLTDDSVSSYFGVTWTFQPDKNRAEAAAKQKSAEAKK